MKLTVPQKRENTGATSFCSVIKRESSARGLLGTHLITHTCAHTFMYTGTHLEALTEGHTEKPLKCWQGPLGDSSRPLYDEISTPKARVCKVPHSCAEWVFRKHRSPCPPHCCMHRPPLGLCAMGHALQPTPSCPTLT